MSIDPSAPFSEGSFSDFQRLSFALQASGVGTWDLDIAQQQVWWDDRCKELYGFSKEDIVPYEQVLRYIYPEDLPLVEQAIAYALHPASQGRYDVNFRTLGAEDQQLRWLHCKGQAIFDANGKALRFSGIAQDITPLMDAQQELHHSDLHWRSLVDHSGTATAVYQGRHMRIQAVNEAMIAIWGKDASVKGKTFAEAIPEVADQPFLGLLQNVYDTGIAYYTPEGPAMLEVGGRLQEFWFTYSYVPLKNDLGQVYGIIHTATDITHQVMARQKIEASEARFRALIEQSPIAMSLYVGRDYIIELANDLMINFWGKGKSVIGKKLSDALPELEGQPFLDLLNQIYTTGVAFTGKAMRADLTIGGILETFYFDFTYQPIINDEGEVYAILNVAIDVTQDVLLQRKYDQSQQALSDAVELAELGIWKIDVASQTAMFSPRVSKWVNDEEVATLPEAMEAIEPEDVPAFLQAYEKAQQTGSSGRLEVEYRLKNQKTGQVRLLQSMGQTLFDEEGIAQTINGFSRDITQQRATQLELEHLVQVRTEELAAINEELQASSEELQTSSEELAESNYRLGESLEELTKTNQQLLFSNERLQRFAYVASHDLQEPLRKIRTFASLVSNKYEKQLAEEGLTYIERISKSGEQMSQLISDLLSYSRLNTQEYQFQPVSLQLVVTQVLETLELRVQQTQAQLKVESLPALMGDESQLRQLFQNLISNALKFTKPEQTPQIHVSSQVLDWDQLPESIKPIIKTEEYHQIKVSDQGIGFDQKYSQRIFEAFQRLHDKSEFKGTGIGLAICQRVVENHGGAISAQGLPGQGAVFSVYLPIVK